MEDTNANFSLVITSDPQWPWYDYVLPKGLTTEKQVEENSERQIRDQYQGINTLADERESTFPVKGVIVNGDLTAYGHTNQLEKMKSLLGLLNPTLYPAIGNHDYANNVGNCANDNCATNMAGYMYEWLQSNMSRLTAFDCSESSYYKFPELRTDYMGSLSYSFDVGSVHVVMLQNYPSYQNQWNTWSGGLARRLFYFIRPSMFWLANDLALARNRGAAIVVFLHDYNDNFVPPEWDKFQNMMVQYGASAVFAGHIHPSCGLIDTIPMTGSDGIQVFRSGAASYQDFLVADFDMTALSMTVTKYSQPMNEPYEAGDKWHVPLETFKPSPPMTVPPSEGYVQFFNDGGFEARFELRYTDDVGNETTNSTGTMRLGERETYHLPPNATNVQVQGEENTGLVWEQWRTVFTLSLASPPNICYRLYGTTLNPKWETEAFQPK